jgi:hypothetical protein
MLLPAIVSAMAAPMPNVDLAADSEKADLIVAGTIVRISPASEPVFLVSAQANSVDDQLYQAELSVARSLAGAPAQGSLTVFFLRGRSPSRFWLELNPSDTVLLFLRHVQGGFVPLTTTGAPIRTLANLELPPAGASRIEAVAHELEQIILKADPVSNLATLVQASVARASMRRPVNLGLLQEAGLDNRTRRLAWVGIALSAGQFQAVAEFERLASSADWSPDPSLARVIVEGTSQLRDPAARPQLAQLMQSRAPGIALAAAMALRQLRTRAAEPDLIRGLDHPDENVRYQAVMGLAELEPSVGEAPSFLLYQRNEAYYLEQWKRWGRQSHIE